MSASHHFNPSCKCSSQSDFLQWGSCSEFCIGKQGVFIMAVRKYIFSLDTLVYVLFMYPVLAQLTVIHPLQKQPWQNVCSLHHRMHSVMLALYISACHMTDCECSVLFLTANVESGVYPAVRRACDPVLSQFSPCVTALKNPTDSALVWISVGLWHMTQWKHCCISCSSKVEENCHCQSLSLFNLHHFSCGGKLWLYQPTEIIHSK